VVRFTSDIQVYNIVSQAKSFQSQVSADTSLSLLTLPPDATLDPHLPASIVVQPITTGLGAGVYNGVDPIIALRYE